MEDNEKEIVDVRDVYADRLKYASYTADEIPEKWIKDHPAQLGKIGALSILTERDRQSLVLAIGVENNIKLATKYTVEEIDFCAEDILMETLKIEDYAYINLARSIGGKTLVLGLSRSARYEYTPLSPSQEQKNGRFHFRWRW